MHQSAPTSLTAFKKQNDTKKRITDKERIYAFLLERTNYELFTRQRIATWLNIPYATVCGRINDLLHEGFVSVVGVSEDNKELLRANIEPIPYVAPFKFNKENVAELLKRQTGKSLDACKIIIEQFINNYKN